MPVTQTLDMLLKYVSYHGPWFFKINICLTNACFIVKISLINNISDRRQGFFCVVAMQFCTMSFNYFPYKVTTSDPSAASKHE